MTETNDLSLADPRLAVVAEWFGGLQERIVAAMEGLEREFPGADPAREPGRFMVEPWRRADPSGLSEGGGRMAVLRGRLFEKMGAHCSTVFGAFPAEFASQISGAADDPRFWAAGVSATPLTKQLGVELDQAGRVKVNPDLSVPDHPEIFAIGDVALVVGKDGKPVPGVSPAAMQMGRHVARVIEAELSTGANPAARPPFKYWDKGTMATIGRSAAVAWIGRLKISGYPAWLAWLFVHLIFLIGFRNRLAVLLQWTYSYFAYKRGARIITHAATEAGATGHSGKSN